MSGKDNGKGKLHRRKVVAFAFLGMLILFCLANLIFGDRTFSEQENRVLRQKPEMTLASVKSGEYMDSYESYLSDQFAGRDLWSVLKTYTDLFMGRRESNGVWKGKDRYLLEEIALPEEEQLQANLASIREFASDYDEIPMYLMLVPGAANVLEDRLPVFAVTEDQDAQFEEIRGTLGDAVSWVDAKDALSSHKKEDIFYRTDSHWTTLGAYYAYQELAQAMDLDVSVAPEWKPYAVTSTFNGTLSSASGYETGYREPIYIYAPEDEASAPGVVVDYVDEQEQTATLYDSSKLEEKDKYAVFLGGDHGMVDIRTTADTTQRLLLVKDSWANCLIPFLTPYYREIIVIDPEVYEGEFSQVMKEYKITSVLFLYNGNHFIEENGLEEVFTK